MNSVLINNLKFREVPPDDRCPHSPTNNAPPSTAARTRSLSPPALVAAKLRSSPNDYISHLDSTTTPTPNEPASANSSPLRSPTPPLAKCAPASAAPASSNCSWPTRPSRNKSGSAIYAKSTPPASARSTPSARRCSAPTQPKPASIPTFGVLDQSDADVLQYDVIDDVLREQLVAPRRRHARPGRQLRPAKPKATNRRTAQPPPRRNLRNTGKPQRQTSSWPSGSEWHQLYAIAQRSRRNRRPRPRSTTCSASSNRSHVPPKKDKLRDATSRLCWICCRD